MVLDYITHLNNRSTGILEGQIPLRAMDHHLPYKTGASPCVDVLCAQPNFVPIARRPA